MAGMIEKLLMKQKAEKGKPDKERVLCPVCKKEPFKAAVVTNHYICTECGSYFRVRTNNRIKMVADRGSFVPWFTDVEEKNPLSFPDYEQKIKETREKTGLTEAFTVGKARIYEEEVCLGICDSRFLMGSMGYVVGEKITAAVERATRERLPVIFFCASGGARMQEGIISLMQMAKTAAALKRHAQAGLLYVSVLTDPTTGGVTASFAMLGDVILAEPGALIGFAGPRVIEQTIGEKLPEGFQSAEFQVSHGMVDAIVERDELKKTLYQLILAHKEPEKKNCFADFGMTDFVAYKPDEIVRERMYYAMEKTPWEKVKAARSLERPGALFYIDSIFEDFMELHGDRTYRDDPAVVGGIAFLHGQPVTVIGLQKGNDPKECEERNYAMASPEGYRKALRLMKQAEKFKRPIITFINTSGAYPGMEAEARGQGEAIARNLTEMASLTVPVLSILIGEGGSGGALGLAVANEVWMMENATYSILSPEGFATILWKDKKRAGEAAGTMKITAEELLKLNVIEKVIPEYGGADRITAGAIAMVMQENIRDFLSKYKGMDGQEIARERYLRFRIF